MEEVYQERQSNMDEVCQKRRKMGPGRCKPYFDQIRVLTRELNSKIEIQKKLKASYEKSLQNVKEILSSASFLRKSASKDVDHCRTHIEQIKAAVRQRGSACTDKLVGEFCVDFWQSGTEDEKKVNELLTMEKSAIFEFIMKARLEYEAYQKRLEENEMIEQACKRNMEEKTTDLEKIEGQIIGVNSVIAELQSALAIQEKYRRKLGNQMELGGCSLYPRPVSHPILGAESVETHDTQIVINVSPCPVCSLAFERETMDIIVASCGHTFHPFCLVCDGNLLNKCPKCLCQMTEMWLKSFGVVEEGTSISHSHSSFGVVEEGTSISHSHSWQKTTEKFNASSRGMLNKYFVHSQLI
jgi:DNA repair exonuclease SbcCD ATPase subunit